MDELFMSAKDEAKAKRALLESRVKSAILVYREITKEAQPKDLDQATEAMGDSFKLIPKA